MELWHQLRQRTFARNGGSSSAVGGHILFKVGKLLFGRAAGNHLQARIFLSQFTVHPAAGGWLRGAPQPAPRSRVNRELREEDPGLEMISRRPPKQKFANFEEYMAAHGGATAPIAGEGPLPELVPEFHLLSVPAENLVPAEDDE